MSKINIKEALENANLHIGLAQEEFKIYKKFSLCNSAELSEEQLSYVSNAVGQYINACNIFLSIYRENNDEVMLNNAIDYFKEIGNLYETYDEKKTFVNQSLYALGRKIEMYKNLLQCKRL